MAACRWTLRRLHAGANLRDARSLSPCQTPSPLWSSVQCPHPQESGIPGQSWSAIRRVATPPGSSGNSPACMVRPVDPGPPTPMTQKRRWGTNLLLVAAPFFICALLWILQNVINRQLDSRSFKCGCRCLSCCDWLPTPGKVVPPQCCGTRLLSRFMPQASFRHTACD